MTRESSHPGASRNQRLATQITHKVRERHGGRTDEGILARILARILALTAAIWHNDKTRQPIMRSLLAYDH